MKIARHNILSREEEVALARRYRAGDKAAGEEIIRRNQLFAAQQAWRMSSYGVPVEDLLQEANLGMLRALELFDPEMGNRFISFAVNWINARLRNRVRDDASLVKLGTTQAQRKLFWRSRAIRGRLEREGVPAEQLTSRIAVELGVKLAEVEEMELRLAGGQVSLNAPVGAAGSGTFMQLLPCDRPTAEEELVRRSAARVLSDQVATALAMLDQRERFIIENRVMAERPMTLQELGDHFGFSRERARMLELRAKEKLRKHLAGLEAA